MRPRLRSLPAGSVVNAEGTTSASFSAPSHLDDVFGRLVVSAIRAAPPARLVYLASMVMLALYTVPTDDWKFGASWLGAITTVLAAFSVFWTWQGKSGPPENARIAIWYSRVILLEIFLLATLSSVLAIRLFPSADSGKQMVLLATLMGVLGSGAIALSLLRGAGISWVVSHAVGLTVAFLATGERESFLLSIPLGVYALILILGVQYLSDTFMRRTAAEVSVAKQQQVLELLLDDDHGEPRDWLWETGIDGLFTGVNDRFAAVAALSKNELQSTPLLRLLTLGNGESSMDNGALSDLHDFLDQGKRFRDLRFPLLISGQVRWWSISGEPITNGEGSVIGWRGVGSDITDELHNQSEMIRLATTDSLTGLANRRQLSEVLHDRLRLSDASQLVAFGMLDLDNFKTVNDTLGHSVGDLLLAQVALRLKRIAEPHGFVARLGGDEFGLVSQPMTPGLGSAEQFRKYVRALRAPFMVEGNRITVAASIGVASATGGGSSTADMLMQADLALYDAKDRGGDRVRSFEPSMGTRARARASLLKDLGRALKAHEFAFYYQPERDLVSGAVIAQEALLRWHHPTRGLLAPPEFLAVAEDSGLIVPIGEMMFREACIEAMSWESNTRIAINVSHLELNASGFIESIVRVTDEVGIDRLRVEFEVNESGAITQPIIPVLHELRNLGCRIALDDFGTGYSSLASLQRLPVDLIKVDREFVAALDGSGHDNHEAAVAVLTSIVEVAHRLGIQALAEGVERADQLSLVQDIGFDFVQGFHVQMPKRSARAHLRLVERLDSDR